MTAKSQVKSNKVNAKAANKASKPVAPKATASKPAKAAANPAKPTVKPAAKKAVVKPVAPKAQAKKTPAKPIAKAAHATKAKPPAKAPAKAAKPSSKPGNVAPKVASKAKASPAPVAKKPAEAKPSKPAKAVVPTPAASVPAAAPAKPTVAPRVGRRVVDKPLLVSPAPDTGYRKEYVPVTASAPSRDLTMKLPPVNAALKDAWKKKTGAQLTEAELLAMPDAEYMNETQLAFFRNRLQTMQMDLIKHADETTEHLREDTLTVPDPADRATIEEEHALELRTRDRERKLLKKIQQVIVMVDSGEYGFCEETGEPIGVRRLLARPTATLSLEAQQRRELKQKLYGD